MVVGLAPVENVEYYIQQSNYIEGVRNPIEVQQSLKAWNYLRHQPFLTDEVVLRVHYFIMRNFPAKGPGRFRKVNVQVGSQLCPSSHNVPYLMDSWIDDMMGYKTSDPKVMHVRFEKIHPFLDGNGRTGRMLMWWHETQLGRTPTLITYEGRWDYYDWFKES
jgi:Fic family protein